MDDGYSPVGILVLIGLIFLEAVFYGFGSAIQNVNEGKLEEELENGNEKAARLLRIVNRPTRFVNTIQITTHLVGIITGIFILPVVVNAAAGKFRTMNLLNSARTMEAVGGTAPAWYADPLWWMWAGYPVHAHRRQVDDEERQKLQAVGSGPQENCGIYSVKAVIIGKCPAIDEKW